MSGDMTMANTGAVTDKTNLALTSPILTTPQINDTSSDHQYIFAVSELIADRTVTLPLLTGNDTFTFNAFAATLTNKSIDSDNNTITNIVNADIKAAAGIVDTKLATISTAGKVSGAAITSGEIAGSTTVNTSGTITTSTAVAGSDFIASLGAVGTPSHTFTGDLDTGMWSSAANVLNFSAGGTEIIEADTSEITIAAVPLRITGAGAANATQLAVRSGDMGMYSDTADTLQFSTAGVNAITISSTQSVGIGATSPTNGKLAVANSASVAANMSNESYNGASNYDFINSRNATIGSHTILVNGDTIGSIRWKGSDGDSFESAGEISCLVDGTPGNADMPGKLVFSTTPDGSTTPTAAMTIDSSQRLLINGPTAVANAMLHVKANGTSTNIFMIEEASGTDNIFGFAQTNSAGDLRIGDTSGVGGILLHGGASDSYIGVNTGDLGVGVAAPLAKLHVQVPTGVAAGTAAVTVRKELSTTDQHFQTFYVNTSTFEGSIRTTSGNLVIDNTSDQVLKKNIKEYKDGLEVINSLRSVTFDWKDKDTSPDVKGFIAQEVQTVLPQSVNKTPDEKYLTLATHEMIPVMWSAIRELSAELDQLKKA